MENVGRFINLFPLSCFRNIYPTTSHLQKERTKTFNVIKTICLSLWDSFNFTAHIVFASFYLRRFIKQEKVLTLRNTCEYCLMIDTCVPLGIETKNLYRKSLSASIKLYGNKSSSSIVGKLSYYNNSLTIPETRLLSTSF